MGVDVVDFLRLNAGVLHCAAQALCQSAPFNIRACDMVGIAGCPVSGNLAVYFRSARDCMVVAL